MCRMKRWIVRMLTACLLVSLLGTVAGQDRNAQLAEAESLYDQAGKLHNAGQFAQAIPLAERALAIIEKLNGKRHPTVAAVLNLLGSLYEEQLDYAKAEQSHLLALTIYMETVGPEHSFVASAATGLASFYMNTGEIEKAEILFGRALVIYEKVSGPESLEVAGALNNLALLYTVRNDYAIAVQVRERAFLIYFKVLGPEDLLVAFVASNLATDYAATGEYAKAEPILQRALVILEKKLGKEHENVATLLAQLAGVYQAMGAYAKAEMSYQRALAIHEKVLGPKHPAVAGVLSNLARLYLTTNDPIRALSLQSRVSEIEEYKIALYLTYGSEQKKQLFLDSQLGNSSLEVSLHTRVLPANKQAAQLAMTTILRRKGRALDAMADLIGTLRLRANPQYVTLFDRLTKTRTQLANLLLDRTDRLSPAQRQDEVNQLNAQNEFFESEISRLNAEFRTQTQPVTLERVQQAIPNDAALVELFIHRPLAAKKPQPEAARYVAYVPHRRSDVCRLG